MASTPTRVTATGFVRQTPGVLESILIYAPNDQATITVYDTDDLTASPIASATILGKYIVAAGNSDSHYLCYRAYKGIYVQFNAGTSVEVWVGVP